MGAPPRIKVIIGISIGVVVLAAAAAIAGPMIYANTVNGQAAAAPTVRSTSAGRLAQERATGTWVSTKTSFAGYRVHEVLQGNDVEVVGRTRDLQGTAVVDGRTLMKGTVTVRVAKIKTPESARDEYFRSTALQTDKYPTATFELTKPVDVSKALDGATEDVMLIGTMDLHGVKKPVSTQAQVAVGAGGTIQVAGSVPIAFADYGVKAPSLGFVTVDGKGAVEFSLDLAKRP